MIDDNYLIKRCLQKDRKCQRILYEKYASLMLGVCMRYTGNREEAEDILQEGFFSNSRFRLLESVRFFRQVHTGLR